MGKVPSAVRKVFLPAVSSVMVYWMYAVMYVCVLQAVCDDLLQRIQLADFNPFSTDIAARNTTLAFTLLWKSLRKQY